MSCREHQKTDHGYSEIHKDLYDNDKSGHPVYVKTSSSAFQK